MKQTVLSNFDLTWLPISGLVMFVICFLVYTFWTYKKSNKKVYESASLIPLEEPVRVSSGIKGN